MRPVLLALAAVVALCGCSAAEPEALPVPSTAPSPSATSAAPSPSPVGGEQQAVEAAVRSYFEGFNRAFETGNADELAKGSTPDCGCRAVVDGVRASLQQGTVQGNRYTVDQVRVRQVKDALATASAVVSSTAGREVAPDGRVLQTLVAQVKAPKELVLRKEASGWLVFSVANG